MNPDEVINSYGDKLGEQPSLETVVRERDETLKKVSKAKELVRLAEHIAAAYQILADVSRGRSKVPAAKVALLVSGLAYLALPLDLVCDAIPVAGLLDDGIVLAWVFSQCAELFKNNEPTGTSKHERRDETHA